MDTARHASNGHLVQLAARQTSSTQASADPNTLASARQPQARPPRRGGGRPPSAPAVPFSGAPGSLCGPPCPAPAAMPQGRTCWWGDTVLGP